MNISSIHLYSVLDKSTNITETRTPHKHAELNLYSISKNDRYIIKDISGLDAEEIVSNFDSFGSGTNQSFYDITLPERVVTILISLNPNYFAGETTEVLRSNLYKMISFNRNAETELRFMKNNDHVSSLFGKLSKFETVLFSSESTVKLTFVCKNPVFLSPVETSETISIGRSNSFSFLDNISTAMHGVYLEVLFPSSIDDLTIYCNTGYDYAAFMVTIPTEYKFPNMTFKLSSYRDNKYVKVRPSGSSVDYSIVENVNAGSEWPLVYPGENSYSIETSKAPTEDFIWQKVSHTKSHWGV